MKNIHYTKAFKKDYKAAQKRGLDVKKLLTVINNLAMGKPLPKNYKAHALQGEWQDFRECHTQPDWLLIWKEDSANLYLARTGSHSDLFK